MGAITSWKGVEGLHLRERELDLWGVRLPFKRGSIEKKEALPSIVANCLLGKEDTDFHPPSPRCVPQSPALMAIPPSTHVGIVPSAMIGRGTSKELATSSTLIPNMELAKQHLNYS